MPPRWDLYRLLSEPVRLRLLALAGEEELAIGELAELLAEAQPKVSKHVKPLRAAGLLAERREGTRVFVHLPESVRRDAVVADALEAGRALCRAEGSLARVAAIVASRDAAARDFFEQEVEPAELSSLPAELPGYLTALGPLLRDASLAIDAGTGDGRLLELLAPIFERVLAFDRAAAQLERAAARLAFRGYANVDLVHAELGAQFLRDRVATMGGAAAVFASRILHHSPRPTEALAELGELAKPGGAVVIIDYVEHDDERMRDEQADLWLGFPPETLKQLARQAGLLEATIIPIPASRCGDGPDGHLDWQVLLARRPNGCAPPG